MILHLEELRDCLEKELEGVKGKNREQAGGLPPAHFPLRHDNQAGTDSADRQHPLPPPAPPGIVKQRGTTIPFPYQIPRCPDILSENH